MKKFILALFLATILFAVACTSASKVEFVQGDHQIDVKINGKLFTSYIYRADLTKPVLYPLLSPSGVKLNRGFPFEKIEGESTDHPHHTGIFFTYDEVNKDGFWNNTNSPPQIQHVEVAEMTSGEGKGRLSVVMNWVAKSGKTLLQENRTMLFSPGKNSVTIDFDLKLTARDTTVVFHDTKEGMFAIRVAQWLTEKNGTAKYTSSNGDQTEKEVWGKRADWVKLEGEKDGKTYGIAIICHPGGTNSPTYWHARGYGLFAANPLGQGVFQQARKEENPQSLNLTLQPGESAIFLFRVIIYEGTMSTEQLNSELKDFAAM